MGRSCSDAALKAYFAKERLHMTNAQCWKRFPAPRVLAREMDRHESELKALAEEFRAGVLAARADGMICPYDPGYPVLTPLSPESTRPFLLFYRGNLSLLGNLNRNVAVIGSLGPDEVTVVRERAIVRCLVENGLTVVSGLAKGCDAAAHRACIEAGGKTVAILPSQLESIYPAVNRGLADEIVNSGGLLLSEYSGKAANRYESAKRFTDRDRLQALFSKAVILIASHRKGEGDSGSRYAMEAAKKFQLCRYVMFDQKQDGGKPLFGLNQDLLYGEGGEDIKVLCRNAIEDLARREDPKLARLPAEEQIQLDID